MDERAHARQVSRRVETGSAPTVLQLPEHRGEISRAVLDALVRDPHSIPATPAPVTGDPLADDDLQLALYLCYELHYRGLPGVSDGWEWEPSLLALRRQVEARFEAGLLDVLGAPEESVAAEDMDVALREVEAADEAPSLSRYLERDGTRDEMLEFVVHRSAYQLKEADPHSWALPASRARRRPRWSRSRPTSTAAGTPSACTARCSPSRWSGSGSTRATAPTSTASRA